METLDEEEKEENVKLLSLLAPLTYNTNCDNKGVQPKRSHFSLLICSKGILFKCADVAMKNEFF